MKTSRKIWPMVIVIIAVFIVAGVVFAATRGHEESKSVNTEVTSSGYSTDRSDEKSKSVNTELTSSQLVTSSKVCADGKNTVDAASYITGRSKSHGHKSSKTHGSGNGGSQHSDDNRDHGSKKRENTQNASNISSILPDDFPDLEENGWKNENEYRCYHSEGSLHFMSKFHTDLSIPETSAITPSGNNYVYSDGQNEMVFYMLEGELRKIDLIKCQYLGFNGLFVSPKEQKTIADILPDDFPASSDNAWKAENGNLCYVSPDDEGVMQIWISYSWPEVHRAGSSWTPLSSAVTEKSGGDYINSSYTFVMSEGKLERIEYDDSWHPEYNGIYTPPQN